MSVMAQRGAALVAAGVLGAFAIGLAVGRVMAPVPTSGDVENSQSVLAVERDDTADRPRRAFQLPRAADADRPAAVQNDAFAYQRLVLDTGGEQPKACFQFSEDLDGTGDTNYGDYIRLTPAAGAVAVDGSTACFTGLGFDRDYSAEIRSGLPSADGDQLARAETIAVAFGDKPAYVGFVGQGVVLPRLEADGVGLETVNVDRLKVTVHRVSDRSLARKQIVAGETSGENSYSYVWEGENGADVGVKVFEDTLETIGERNDTTTSVFALGAALEDLKPGAYFIRLRDVSDGADPNRPAQAWRWIMFTDMALTTYTGADGVDVFVRSIANARPIPGVELTLVATNNDILATGVTNADGRVRFDGATVNGAHPLTPRMVMAYGPQEDFAALDLSRSPIDLSDRNIAGRAAPSNVDGFVYLDRGIYRPGETVRISGLLRDSAGRAISDRPATITIRRPNGTTASQERIDELDIGGFTLDYALPVSSPRGSWSISVKADGIESQVGGIAFSVEDFVPQRLEVNIEMDEKTAIRPGTARDIAINSRYLYGAPASALPVEAEARLRLDPNPFPDFSEFRYGPIDGSFNERFIKLANTTTDAEGAAATSLNLDDVPKNYGAPMRADIVVGVVEPGGRVVRESARVPVRPDDYYVGLKLGGDKTNFGLDDTASVEAVLLDWSGDVVDGEVEWKLVEEDYWFDWYRVDGAWRWRRSHRDILVAEGRDETGREALGQLISQRLGQGSYRLTVRHAGGSAESQIRFYVGWRSYAAGADTPDQAALTLQSESVTPGARARLYLNPPYEGEALITIATDRVHLVERMKVGDEGREVIVDTDADWGGGFYVMATVVTPRDPGERPAPRRAMGVAYVPFDMGGRTLSVDLQTPEVFRPRTTLDLPIKIDGVERGSDVRMTIAAVDEGILRLTKHKSPDPVDYYFGKKRLGVTVRDDYSRMLNANLGAPARFGGDQLGGEGLTVVPTKSVALFSGVLEVGADGTVQAPIEVPDFNGELRLMAVAWSEDALGAASKPLTVRDRVPAELALPRFLAPGDTSTATLLIDNVDGAAGEYTVTIAGEGPVDLNQTQRFTLARGQSETAEFPIGAQDVGIGAVSMSVEGPDGFSVSRTYPIQSRTPYFPVTQIMTDALEPGDSFQLSEAIVDGFVPGSTDVSLSFSRLRGIEPAPLLDALHRYPYGCTEQLTSSAFPLLFVDTLGAAIGRGPERELRPRVQRAVNRLLDRQGPSGDFGLWRVSDRHASPWLGAYVADFLYRASAEGYSVPDEALERIYKSLGEISRVDSWYPVGYQTQVVDGYGDTRERLRRRSSAYALYVLARAGRADISDLRYFHDTLLDSTDSPLARAHIGAALALMGDRARAANAFALATTKLGWGNRGDYYQTDLRDAAGVLALAAEVGRNDDVEPLTEKMMSFMKDPQRMHTQEKAYVLMAAQALLRASGPLALAVDGDSIDDLDPIATFGVSLNDLMSSKTYRNDGDGRIYRALSVTGAPLQSPPALAIGFTITKRYATRDGRAVDLSTVRQNDRIVVVINARATDNRLHPSVIADLLPAGFEIETILSPADGAGENNNGPYKWAGTIARANVAEARDDRFVAAVDVRGGQGFTLAYVVRAISPGEYAVPGVVIEDMYRPGVVARSVNRSLRIASVQ